MMLHLKSTQNSEEQSLSFLEENPTFSRTLFISCNYDVAEVKNLLDLILKVCPYHQSDRFYIQAISTGNMTFLVTNLAKVETVKMTNSAASWLLGRSSNCAIAIPDSSISRQHAAIGHDAGQMFYITDVGSSNGTWVNHRRLAHLERCTLSNGDLIQLGTLKVEFLMRNSEVVPSISRELSITEIY